MKTSITNASVNESSPVPPLAQPIHFNSQSNFKQINSFRDNNVQNQFNNNSNPGFEYLPPPEIIANPNNPNYNIILSPTAKNPTFINVPYIIQPQLNNPINPPPPPAANALQYNNLGNVKMSRSKFTPQEDATLKELVAKYGSTKWSEIAMKLPNRTGRQCRERWKNYLAPGIQNGPWSQEEDALLVQKVKELGTMWSKMVQFFPGRTDVNLKNRWVTLRYKKNNGNNSNNNEDDESENGKLNYRRNHGHIHENNEIEGNDENDDEENNNNNPVIVNNIVSSDNNNAVVPVYPNFVSYTPYYNYPTIQIAPPPPPPPPPPTFNAYYATPDQIEYRPPAMEFYFGDPITIKESSDFDRNRIRGSYTDIGTETDAETNGNHVNFKNGNSSDRFFKNNKQSPLEPSIILSQPRWLLNHKSNDASFEDNGNTANSNDQNDNVNSEKKSEVSKIKLNSSSFQQSSQTHDRLEVPLLVAMPLGTSS
ncbi:hypothetical protein M9Y10_038849 [Tritrichomonas musculus]|uniref:Myb-like DNA-binding domain containing protein n=1 Tax=Tritrichomonas musculus TaxID=1915356 RepID=A0ABR2KBD1_9EUKA